MNALCSELRFSRMEMLFKLPKRSRNFVTFPSDNGTNGSFLASDGFGGTYYTSIVPAISTNTLTVSGNANLNGTTTIIQGSIDGTLIGNTNPSSGTFTSLKAGTLNVTGNATIVSGSITNTPIGSGGPALGNFTDLTMTSIYNTGNSLLSGTTNILRGTIDNTTIGTTTRASAAFTSLVSNSLNVSGNSTLVAGTIDNIVIGNTTPSQGNFLSVGTRALTVSGSATLVAGTINNTSIGATRANSGNFTSLAATTLSAIGNTTLNALTSTTLAVSGNTTLNNLTASNLSLIQPSGSNSTNLGSQTSSAAVAFNLPNSNGTASQYLQTDGSGNTSWVSIVSPTTNLVQATYANVASTISSVYVVVDYNFRAEITLRSTSSRVKLHFSGMAFGQGSITLYRIIGPSIFVELSGSSFCQVNSNTQTGVSINFIDSPGQALGYTYAVYYKAISGGNIFFGTGTNLNVLTAEEVL